MNTSAAPLKKFLFAVMLAAAPFLGCAMESTQPEPPSELAEIKPIQPVEWTLPNGLHVMFLEDDELPLVAGSLYTRGGSLLDDPKHPGVAEVMGEQMRQGGAGARDADKLDEDLEKLAADVSSGIGEEFGRISFSALSADFSKIFDIFSDVVLEPRFAQERLMLEKGQALESIRRRVDDPGTISSLSFRQLLFGDTAYGVVETAADIQYVTRERVLASYRRFVRPDGALLTVTGKLDPKVLREAVARRFSAWEPRGRPLPAVPPVNFTPTPGIYFIEGPFAQATLSIGHQGPPRLTPDYPAIEVFNNVFGIKGFGSRLMLRVRSELGLAYGINGAIVAGVVKGRDIISAQTKAESTDRAIVESVKVLQGMQSELVPPAELKETKDSLRNSFVFKFDSPGEALDRRALLDLLHYPADYDLGHLARIDAVTSADVEEVARARWDPSKFVIVVVGNEKAYSRIEQLSKRTDADVPEVIRTLPLYHARFDQKLILDTQH